MLYSVCVFTFKSSVMNLDALEFARKRFIAFKILGFASVTIINWKSVTKPIDVLFFLLPLSGGFFSCYFAIFNRNKFTTSKSEIADYGNFIMMIAAICIAMISMITAFVFRHSNWNIIIELTKIESKV